MRKEGAQSLPRKMQGELPGIDLSAAICSWEDFAAGAAAAEAPCGPMRRGSAQVILGAELLHQESGEGHSRCCYA